MQAAIIDSINIETLHFGRKVLDLSIIKIYVAHKSVFAGFEFDHFHINAKWHVCAVWASIECSYLAFIVLFVTFPIFLPLTAASRISS